MKLLGQASGLRLRDAVRREKWRLRTLKRFVLPLRNCKRQIAGLCQKVTGKSAPRIERSTFDYLASGERGSALKIHSAERVIALVNPFEPNMVGPKGDSSEPAYNFELHDIDFWARYGGSVITADSALLADLSPEVWGVENHPIFSSFRLPRARALPGRTAILVTPEARRNYYHWIVDLLPRALLIKAAAGDFQGFDQIVINGSRASYEEFSLRAIGIPLDKLRYVDARDRFRILCATIPSMDHFSKIVAPWKICALRKLRDRVLNVDRGPQPAPAATRIYISRKHAAVRRIFNESALVPLLHAAGFIVVELESLQWTEQVRLFSDAEVILAPHGAALANIAFCRANTLVAEIGTRLGYLDFYLRLAASGTLRYRLLEAQPRNAAQPDSLRAFENEDMILPESELRRFLGEL